MTVNISDVHFLIAVSVLKTEKAMQNAENKVVWGSYESLKVNDSDTTRPNSTSIVTVTLSSTLYEI